MFLIGSFQKQLMGSREEVRGGRCESGCSTCQRTGPRMGQGVYLQEVAEEPRREVP